MPVLFDGNEREIVERKVIELLVENGVDSKLLIAGRQRVAPGEDSLDSIFLKNNARDGSLVYFGLSDEKKEWWRQLIHSSGFSVMHVAFANEGDFGTPIPTLFPDGRINDAQWQEILHDVSVLSDDGIRIVPWIVLDDSPGLARMTKTRHDVIFKLIDRVLSIPKTSRVPYLIVGLEWDEWGSIADADVFAKYVRQREPDTRIGVHLTSDNWVRGTHVQHYDFVPLQVRRSGGNNTATPEHTARMIKLSIRETSLPVWLIEGTFNDGSAEAIAMAEAAKKAGAFAVNGGEPGVPTVWSNPELTPQARSWLHRLLWFIGIGRHSENG
jgi:hypothetical protein